MFRTCEELRVEAAPWGLATLLMSGANARILQAAWDGGRVELVVGKVSDSEFGATGAASKCL